MLNESPLCKRTFSWRGEYAGHGAGWDERTSGVLVLDLCFFRYAVAAGGGGGGGGGSD